MAARVGTVSPSSSSKSTASAGGTPKPNSSTPPLAVTPPSSSHWDTTQIPRLDGRIAIVTGCNVNLGLETARALALAGAHVLVACRCEARSRAAAEAINQQVANAWTPDSVGIGRAEFLVPCDLGDLGSIRGFSDAIAGRVARVDILVNNAEMKAVRYATTVNGHEQHPDAHVVHVTSISHHYVALTDTTAGFNVFPPEYEAMDAYRKSKLATMRFAYELDRRLRRAGIATVRSAPCRPGVTESHLLHSIQGTYDSVVARWVISDAMGALCILNAATDPHINGGEFIRPHRWFDFYASPRVVTASPQRHDEAASVRLWAAREELTGIAFDVHNDSLARNVSEFNQRQLSKGM